MNKKLCTLIGALVLGSTLTTTNVMASTGPTENPVPNYKSTYTWNKANTGAGGGFIPAIIFNQSEKDLIYARTDMGGAYRWNPKTNSWIGLSDWVGYDNWNLLGCESLATDPVETNRVYIASGTYTNDWAGNGAILRSTDKGDTWQKTDLPFKIGGNMPGRSMGERLVIDPNDNKILYLGTHNGNGLWKSEDYGVTWNKVESFTNTGDYVDPNFKDTTGVVWVTFDPTTGSKGSATQTIYVGVADTKNSIYKSTDGGKTWNAVEGQPTMANQPSWIKIDDTTKQKNPRAFLPHHGVLGSDGNLYITYSNDCGPYDGSRGDVWRYNTKTGQWKNISPVPSSSDDDYFGYGGLAVDSQNPKTLVVSSMNSWWPDAKMFRSTDGGETWKPIWEFDGYPTRKFYYKQDISKAPWLDWGTVPQVPEINPKLGWMTGGVSIDPFNSDRMMYGTGATLYGSDNLTNWDKGEKIDIDVKATGIEEENVLALVSPPSGTAHLITGMGDVSGFVHDDLTTVPKTMMNTPNFNTGSIDYAETKSNFIVRSGNVSKDNKATTRSCAFSYDGGHNWFSGQDIPGISEEAGGTVAAAADATAVVWSPSGSGTKKAYYSTNNGSAWIATSGLPDGAKVASDRVNPKKFYGFVDGAFYVSTDGGATFAKTAAIGLPKDGKFKAVPGMEGEIWLAAGTDGMWHSKDSGNSFTKVSGIQASETVGFGKAAEGKNYMSIYTGAKIGNIRGIFRSDDEGKTWIRINDDNHQYGAANADISGDPRIYGRVYLATNGLGAVYGDINKEETVKYGDINGDGDISVVDLVLLKKYLSESETTGFDTKAADVNQDGEINISDLVVLRGML